ncbi:dimethylaniline monooxygenase (N-oxide forming) [Cadophora sp. MPI-SDFR-AT-0126]|nr:dimethylaniline monooxygenase (N-oxide forming) [Leotiomycetes sp. MPI-SDFR-AT-0126]
MLGIRKDRSSLSVLKRLPVSAPKLPIEDNVNVESVLALFKNRLSSLDQNDFVQDAIWRDTFALTGTLRTFYSASSAACAWAINCKRSTAVHFNLESESAQVVRMPGNLSWISVYFTFETASEPQSLCCGYLDIVAAGDGQWKIWVLRTVLEQLKNCANIDKLEPVLSDCEGSSWNTVKNGTNGTNGVNGTDGVNGTNGTNGVNGHTVHSNGALTASHPYDFDCVVVGGGPAGLSTGGRLKSLGLSYVVLDRNEQAGDNWKNRYSSARLHTPRNYAHLPYERTFPPEVQQYITKDELAKGYNNWVKKFGIKVWNSTELISGSWDDLQKLWTLSIMRRGKEEVITTPHVVLSVGCGAQTPNMPSYPDKDRFRGTVLHSVEYESASEWKGLKGVVIGTANTAHDVAEDMLGAEMTEVMMVQRNKTYILPVEYNTQVMEMTYNDQIPTEVADRLYFSLPNGIGSVVSQLMNHESARAEPERFEALEKVGFDVERWGDVFHHLVERGGGHYIDVGCSKLISDGKIKVKSKANPVRYVEDGLLFDDGSLLKADVIVFATGFESNMRMIVENLFGPKVASKSEDFWGLDPEGEVLGAFKPQRQPGLWYMGGNIGHARYWSRHVAMQIKADLLGTPFKVFSEVL